MSGDDVPSSIDFRDPAQAKAWEATTMARRPYRTQFFAGFVAAIRDQFSQSVSLLELGSGPGHLAEQILRLCEVSRYVALDFSAAMHDLARERLGAWANKVEFVERDFRAADWPKGLGLLDCVVTMQAAHETRHKRHLPDFLSRARQCLVPGGMLLYCDHYWEAGTTKESATGCKRGGTAHRVARCGLHARGEAFGCGRHGFVCCYKFKLTHYCGTNTLPAGSEREQKPVPATP